MIIRGIPLRAVLIPVCVAVLSVAGLAWYGFVKIPSQQRYLNEQNIRLLRTTSAQIQGKVNNFDQAIDHALESFDFPHNTRKGQLYSDDFKAYVRLFVNDLDIVDGIAAREVCEKGGKELYSDPPRVKIEVDEGTHYLDLCYEHGSHKISAKADIEHVVAGYLSARTEFDTVALVDSRARVITQYPVSELKMSRLDRLTIASGGATLSLPKESGARQNDTPPNVMESLRATGNIEDVTIAGADYRLYVQPVQLSLKSESGDDSEEWALCGLVRIDHFRSASSAISSTYWLLMIAALVVLCATIPLLKLHALNARERFHQRDGVFVAISTFVFAGLLTFALFDIYYFGYAFTTDIDRQLQDLATEIQKHFAAEVAEARKELDKLRPGMIADASHETMRGKDGTKPRIVFEKEKLLRCEPQLACKQDVLSDPEIIGNFDSYPYFNIVSGTDITGQQRIKWTTTTGITPFINISDEKLAYFHDLELARRLPAVAGVPHSGVSVLQSPNTGEPLTVFWQAVNGESSNLTAISLATTPVSVGRPVLPKGIQFAILDPEGQVLFHSDSKRSLHENFFQETGDNPRLRALIAKREAGTLNSKYLGGPHRLFVTPIVLASAVPATFKDPEWSLIVLQDSLMTETVNIEMVTLGTLLFAAYGLMLAAAWFLAYRVYPRSTGKWFWPDDRKAASYRRVAQVNLISLLLFLALIARASGAWLLAGTGLLSLGTLAATFAIVTRSRLSSSSPGAWKNDFMLARVLFLFVIAAAPAMACFEVAHHFEARLLNDWRHFGLLADLNARDLRVEKEIASLGLCKTGEEDHRCEKQIRSFLKQRLEQKWDIHVATVAPLDPPDGLSQVPGRLDRLLSLGHLPYNAIAMDLSPAPVRAGGSTPHQEALSSSALPAQRDGFGPIAIAVAGALSLWLLVWFAARRLFVLELYVPPGVRKMEDGPASNLLLVGPPGAGKSDVLGKQSNSTVFDVRTSRLWLNSRGPLTLPERSTCAFDHLEHQFDDPSFRKALLVLLEELLYRRHCTVLIASARDPLEQLRETQATDLDAWQRILQPFRLQVVGMTAKPDPGQVPEISRLVERATGAKDSHLTGLVLEECSFAPWLISIAQETLGRLPAGSRPAWEDLLFEIGLAAEPFYRNIWLACSKDEKLTLRQLAKEGVVNPCNAGVVARLLRTGLVSRHPLFRVMNESFRRFILQERQSEGLDAWEHEGIQRPWSSVTITILTLAFGLVAVLVLTQQQLLESWLGYVPALAPAFPMLAKFVAGIQRSGKPQPEAVA